MIKTNISNAYNIIRAINKAENRFNTNISNIKKEKIAYLKLFKYYIDVIYSESATIENIKAKEGINYLIESYNSLNPIGAFADNITIEEIKLLKNKNLIPKNFSKNKVIRLKNLIIELKKRIIDKKMSGTKYKTKMLDYILTQISRVERYQFKKTFDSHTIKSLENGIIHPSVREWLYFYMSKKLKKSNNSDMLFNINKYSNNHYNKLYNDFMRFPL